jgi:hypothetical protein
VAVEGRDANGRFGWSEPRIVQSSFSRPTHLRSHSNHSNQSNEKWVCARALFPRGTRLRPLLPRQYVRPRGHGFNPRRVLNDFFDHIDEGSNPVGNIFFAQENFFLRNLYNNVF